MNKRDWFASMALQGLLSNSHDSVVKSVFGPNPRTVATNLAKTAYEFADAMLAARGEK
jgi:hypothetical protein